MATIRCFIWWILLINGLLQTRINVYATVLPVKNESTCAPDKFRCNNGLCIKLGWRCDQENDCSDGSDEDPSMCMNNCKDTEVKCESGDQCIPRSWVCDGRPDCRDNSDESKCNDTCRSDEFTCDNGHCIQKPWRCDYNDDCGDGSDEKNCPKMPCSGTDFTCANGACIPKKWACDGDPDCTDASDEVGCSNVTQAFTTCLKHEYACKDHITCLNSKWVCDGEKDCPDGDDELANNCKTTTCRPDQFQCHDRSCIAGHLACNGQADCPDHSDEENCDISKQTRCNATTQFDCGGGQCIPLSQVCDKKKNCPDGEDEPAGKCDVNECAVNNGGCSHKCIDQPVGYRCECNMGYTIIDNKNCVDINECLNPGACSQICINEIGGFKCECEAGYMRDPRNHTRCKASEGHASLLLARRHDIRKIALDHSEMTSIVNNTKSATALDFVFRTGMIFWSDVTTQSIYKAPIDEGNEKTVVLKDHSVTSDGLAVDWVYNHVYFTDTRKCTIELTNFDGNMGKVLIEDELDIPRSIALDPIEGWMYWSDWGASPRIERAGMDGTHRTTIINYDVKWPNGITLDLVRKRIYWVDGKLNVISSASYDGSQRRQVLYSTEYLRHPFSITTFEDYIYWTDWDKQTVFKANKFNGQNVEPITAVHMLQNPMVIHVYHPYRQPDGINHCQAVNGHCSHLCLPAPRINEHSPRISCACPTGLKLMDDRLMCVEDLSYKPVTPPTRRTMPTRPAKYTTQSSSSKSAMSTTLAPVDSPNDNENNTEEALKEEKQPYDTYPGEYLYEICEIIEELYYWEDEDNKDDDEDIVIQAAAANSNDYLNERAKIKTKQKRMAELDTLIEELNNGKVVETAVTEADLTAAEGMKSTKDLTKTKRFGKKDNENLKRQKRNAFSEDLQRMQINGNKETTVQSNEQNAYSANNNNEAIPNNLNDIDIVLLRKTAETNVKSFTNNHADDIEQTYTNLNEYWSSTMATNNLHQPTTATPFAYELERLNVLKETPLSKVTTTNMESTDIAIESTMKKRKPTTTALKLETSKTSVLPTTMSHDGVAQKSAAFEYDNVVDVGFYAVEGENTDSNIDEVESQIIDSIEDASEIDVPTDGTQNTKTLQSPTVSSAPYVQRNFNKQQQQSSLLYIRWLCRRMNRVPNYPTKGVHVDKHPAGNATHTDDTIIPLSPPDSGYIAFVVIVSLVGFSFVVGALLIVLYRHCSRRTATSINFENPVYRKTTEDHFSLEKNLPTRMYPSTVDEESSTPLREEGTACV